MSPAKARVKPGFTRRLELHLSNFIVEAHALSVSQVGELFQMLMAEAAGDAVPKSSDRYVAQAWAKRDSYRRIRGSFGRVALALAVRVAVFVRDGRACRYCGDALTWNTYRCDHVDPVASGGSDDMSNLAASCAPCNSSKAAKALEDWLAAR